MKKKIFLCIVIVRAEGLTITSPYRRVGGCRGRPLEHGATINTLCVRIEDEKIFTIVQVTRDTI